MIKNLASTLDYETTARELLNQTASAYFADRPEKGQMELDIA